MNSDTPQNPLADAAKLYDQIGLIITPLRPRSKAAYLPKWNEGKRIDVVKHWEENPNDNIGLILEPSGMCVLDIDNLEEFLLAVKSIGLTPNNEDRPFWDSDTAGIKSGKPNRAKLIFKCPPDIELKYHKLQWNDAGGGKHTVFELRAGFVQDVLPPSIHPDTQKPYVWVGGQIRPLPDDLLLLWKEWEVFEPALQKADRFYTPPTPPRTRGRPRSVSRGRDLISEWKVTQDLGQLLERYGYERVGNRYISPDSHSNSPGVILSDDGTTFFCFNESDYFADNHQHNAFDLVLHYEHKDNMREAIEGIKQDLGMFEIKDDDLLQTVKSIMKRGDV